MTAPTPQTPGAQVASTGGSVSPAWPSHLTNDIGLLVVETSGNSATMSTPSGWAPVTGSPITDVATTAGTKLHIFWKRATSSSEPSVATGALTDHIVACIYTFRGCITTGNPWNVVTTSTKATASTSVTFPSVTTIVADSLVVLIAGRSVDNASTTAYSGYTNSNLTGLAEAGEAGTANGNGGGFVLAYGTKSTAGSTGTTTATVVSSSEVYMTLALTPLPPVLSQTAYRFYEDGTETGSTATAAQNTNITRDVTADSNLALRMRLQETSGNSGTSTDDYQLQYSQNSGTYYDVGSGPTSVATYYFNASDSGPTDSLNGWTNDANAFDGNTATQAAGGGTTGRYLVAGGTNAPTSGNSITQVRMRFGGIPVSTIDYSGYVVLTAPAGGWTWSQVNNLVVRVDTIFNNVQPSIYTASDTGFTTSLGSITYNTSASLAIVEVEVTSVSAIYVQPYASANLTDSGATTNRLGAGTGSFVAGEVSEDGLVDDHQITASNYTEYLYALTLVASALANGDTVDFRVLRNAATTDLTYTVTPRITVSKTGGYTPNTTGEFFAFF